MYPELTNLLPPERLRAVKREYFLRLATAGVFALALVVVGSGILLLPSYLYLNQQIQVAQTHSNDIDAHLSAIAGQSANTRISSLSADADYLARLQQVPSASTAFRAVLIVSRPGIALTGFTYSPAQHKNDGKMTLTGLSQTRETLHAYTDALTALPFVTNVDLPISAYAKDSSIPFTITLMGTLMP